MKKEKSKSASKKAKRELVDELSIAFTTVVSAYSKVKKTKSVIEKFAKQLSNKIDLKSKIAIVSKEIAPVKEKIVKAKTVKKVVDIKEN